jgi:hypothetical protein
VEGEILPRHRISDLLPQADFTMNFPLQLTVVRTTCIAMVLTVLSTSPAGASGSPAPEASRYGVVHDHLSTSTDVIQRARDAGFGWVNYSLYWNLANPTHVDCDSSGVIDLADTCNVDWSHFDTEIQRLADAGLNIYIHIVYPPSWTMGSTYPNSEVFYCYSEPEPDDLRKDDPFNCENSERRPGYRAQYSPDNGNSYPPDYDRSGDFRLFVEAAVRRYKDRARAWGFGAEVHSRVFWRGSYEQFFDEILRPGYETVKAVDPTLLVVGPEEDQIEERPGEIGAFEYLLNFETQKNVRVFDIISFHILNQTYKGDVASLDTTLKPLIERVRRGRPLWLTEVGYYSGGGLADDFQQAWIAEWLAGIAARPWIDKTFVYRLMDASAVDFGLLNEDGTPKPSYAAAQQFVSAQATPRFYYLAEGATKSFFDLDIAIANPNGAPAPVKISFLKPDGTVVLQTPTLAANSRLTIRVDTLAGLESSDVSTVVESTSGLPLAVERTMFWDSGAYGGHTDLAVQAPAQRWYFAEGSQGFFDTYVLLANSNIVPANVTVTFLLQGAPPVEKSLTVGSTARSGFCACQYDELLNRSFGIVVDSDQPIIAERAMYFGSNPFWTADHESAGVTAPATSWFLAEGRTGPVFDVWILVSNPGDDTTTMNVEFVTSAGTVVAHPDNPISLAGKSRTSIYVDAIPGLTDVAVSTTITSDLPVVAERAMYWPGTPGEWYEAHNSFGVTATGTRWAVAEGRAGNGGRTGTDPGFETYILVYNTADTPANVTVTYLLEGGESFSVTRVMGRGRTDVVDWIEDSRLANRSFGALIEADQPIAVERAMYWRGMPGRPWGWGGSNATAVKVQ